MSFYIIKREHGHYAATDPKQPRSPNMKITTVAAIALMFGSASASAQYANGSRTVTGPDPALVNSLQTMMPRQGPNPVESFMRGQAFAEQRKQNALQQELLRQQIQQQQLQNQLLRQQLQQR